MYAQETTCMQACTLMCLLGLMLSIVESNYCHLYGHLFPGDLFPRHVPNDGSDDSHTPRK